MRAVRWWRGARILRDALIASQLAVGLTSLGCTARIDLDIPHEPWVNAILLGIEAGPNVEVHALDLSELLEFPDLVPGERQVYALLLEESLEELTLPHGQLDLRAAAADRAPPFDRGYATTILDGEAGPWVPIDQAPSWLRLPPLDVDACSAAGGCVVGFTSCRLACTRPELTTPTLPQPPQAPRFGPCPAGWASVRSEAVGIDVCEPRLESSCPSGQVGPPGEGCSRLGPPCPASGFADDLPSGPNIFYVEPPGRQNGDGSLLLPFGSIVDAIQIATAGAIIALAPGDYSEPVVVVPLGVEVWGACVEQTRLRSAFLSAARNISAEGLIVEPPGARLENVVVSRLSVLGGNVTVDGIHVLEYVNVRGGALQLARGVLGALYVEGSTARATVERVVVRSSEQKAVSVRRSAGLYLSESVIEPSDSGIFVVSASATISDSIIRAPLRPSESVHFAIEGSDSRVSLERVVLEQGEGGAAYFAAGSRAVLADVVAVLAGHTTREEYGGIYVNGASMVADRVAVDERSGRSILIAEGAAVRMTDLSLRAGSCFWSALSVSTASLTLDRAAIIDRRLPGACPANIPSVVAIGFGSVSLNDVQISGSKNFTGITVGDAAVALRGVLIDEVVRAIDLFPGADAAIHELTIRGASIGIYVQGSSSALTVTDALITASTVAGVDVRGGETTFERLSIRDTSDPTGRGTALRISRGRLTLREFELVNSSYAGLQISPVTVPSELPQQARVRASSGLISRNEVGVSLLGVGLEALDAFEDVLFEGNAEGIKRE